MTYQLDSESKDTVGCFGTANRWIRLTLVALLCLGLPLLVNFILERKRSGPFDPESEGYPFVAVLMIVIPLALFADCLYGLRKGFRRMFIDTESTSMSVTWHGLFGEWTRTFSLEAIRTFDQKRVVLSEYRYGWELRAHLLSGQTLGLAQYYDEDKANAAVSSINQFIAANRTIEN